MSRYSVRDAQVCFSEQEVLGACTTDQGLGLCSKSAISQTQQEAQKVTRIHVCLHMFMSHK